MFTLLSQFAVTSQRTGRSCSSNDFCVTGAPVKQRVVILLFILSETHFHNFSCRLSGTYQWVTVRVPWSGDEKGILPDTKTLHQEVAKRNHRCSLEALGRMVLLMNRSTLSWLCWYLYQISCILSDNSCTKFLWSYWSIHSFCVVVGYQIVFFYSQTYIEFLLFHLSY